MSNLVCDVLPVGGWFILHPITAHSGLDCVEPIYVMLYLAAIFTYDIAIYIYVAAKWVYKNRTISLALDWSFVMG